MNPTIQKLESRIGDLIKLTESMRRENETLRSDQKLLRREYDALREKNRIAGGRVEQIAARLKSLQA